MSIQRLSKSWKLFSQAPIRLLLGGCTSHSLRPTVKYASQVVYRGGGVKALLKTSPLGSKGFQYCTNRYLEVKNIRVCSSCGANLMDQGVICGVCDNIITALEADNMSPFQIFGLRPRFDIDLEELQSKYRNLQKQIHPDKCARAEYMSGKLSSAMKALRLPDVRAIQILKVFDIPVDQFENQTEVVDMAYLMWIVEEHDKLTKIESMEDVEEQKQSLKEVSELYKEEAKRLEGLISEELNKLTVDDTSNGNINNSKEVYETIANKTMQLVGKRRLLYRLENKVNDIEESWDD